MRKSGFKKWAGFTLTVFGIIVFMFSVSVMKAQAGKCKQLVVIWNAGTCPTAFLNIAKEYTKKTGIAIKGAFVP